MKCNEYGTEFSISFNDKKSKCILFICREPSKANDPLMPLFYINDKLIEYVITGLIINDGFYLLFLVLHTGLMC